MKKFLLATAMTAVMAITASAVSFGSAGNDKPKSINIDGKDYEYVIGTALKDGKYFVAGSRLANGLPKSVAAETDGSKQNMELLSQGQINGAIVQADAFNTFLEANPQYKDKLLAVSLDAEEQIQIVMLKGKGKGDLQNKKASIYVGPMKSGGAASWYAMTKLEPDYAKAAVISDDYSATSEIALSKVKSGEYSAIIRTSLANPDDKFVKNVVADKELEFINVNDYNLNDKILINGKEQSMYEFRDMAVANGFFGGKKVEVPAVKVLFVFNKDLYSTTQLNTMLENISIKKSGLFK